MSVADKQKKTAQAFLDGYNAMTSEAVLAPRADECIHNMLPASMNRAGKSNEEYRTFITKLGPMMKDMKVIHSR